MLVVVVFSFISLLGVSGGGLVIKRWTHVALQAPLSMGFPRQEYWDGLLFPSPGDLPNPGVKPASPRSPALQANSSQTKSPGKPSQPA